SGASEPGISRRVPLSLDSGSAPNRAHPGMTTLGNRTPRNDASRTAPRRRRRGQYLVRGAIGRVFLPAHRPERPLQHAADTDRLDPHVEGHGALMQRALGLRGAVALAQVIEPGRTMVT